MTKTLLSAILAGAGVAFTATLPAQVAPQTIPDRYIVVLKPYANPNAVALNHGVRPEFTYSHALNGFAGVIPPARLLALARHHDVESIEEDQVVSIEAQSLPTGVNRSGADSSASAKIDGVDERVNVDIAIIDTGIELSHPDLNVYQNVSFVTGTRTGNDDHGHGTHVAGTAAAIDNNNGVVGVAPGARLWAVKVLSRSGSGTMSGIIKGVDYVTANASQIEVANMSLGGGNSETLKTAIRNSVAKGVVYVVAAGNSATDASGTSPANSSDVLCVSAIADSDGLPGGGGPATSYGADDTFASFSNFGSVVDIAAPGVDILSTYRGNGYAIASGTSMASPHVAGAVGLYLAGQSKPANATDVANVRAAIISAGCQWSDTAYFTGGSKDGVNEPLLNVSGF